MIASWVRETTTTTGTGSLTISGVAGYPRFVDVFPAGSVNTDLNGSLFPYAILDDATGAPIELGSGVLTNSGNTLVRERVIWTYSGGTFTKVSPSAVSLPAGTKRVVCADHHGLRMPGVGMNTIDTNHDRLSAHHVTNATTGEATDAADQLRGEAYLHATPIPVTHFGCRISTSVASGACRMGLYAMVKNVNYPVGQLIAESGEFDCSTGGMKVSAPTIGTFMLPPGWYWLARHTKSNGTGFRSYGGGWLGGPTLVHDFGYGNHFYKTVAYGASMPSLLGSAVTSATPGGSTFVGFLRLAY